MRMGKELQPQGGRAPPPPPLVSSTPSKMDIRTYMRSSPAPRTHKDPLTPHNPPKGSKSPTPPTAPPTKSPSPHTQSGEEKGTRKGTPGTHRDRGTPHKTLGTTRDTISAPLHPKKPPTPLRTHPKHPPSNQPKGKKIATPPVSDIRRFFLGKERLARLTLIGNGHVNLDGSSRWRDRKKLLKDRGEKSKFPD